jgi:hypothetical protein
MFFILIINYFKSFLQELSFLEWKIFIFCFIFFWLFGKLILKSNKIFYTILLSKSFILILFLSQTFLLIQNSLFNSLLKFNFSFLKKIILDKNEIYQITESSHSIQDLFHILWDNFFIVYLFRSDCNQWNNLLQIDFINYDKLNYFTFNQITNFCFLTVFLLFSYFWIKIFISNKSNNFFLLLINLSFLFFIWLFLTDSNSMILFFLSFEIFSFIIFFFVFLEKQNKEYLIINFLMLSLSIFSSICFLISLYIYYSETGTMLINPILANFPSKQLFLIFFYSFIFFKLGFFPIIFIFLNFYKNTNSKVLFSSLLIFKTFIFWFLFLNFEFFKNTLIVPILSKIFLLNLILSILLAFYFFKNNIVSNKNVIFLVSYFSSCLILLLWISSNSFLNNLYSILFYFICSTLLFSIIFFIQNQNQFLILILLYLGFPGILFAIKLNLFSFLFYLNINLTFIIFLILIIMFTFFIQEKIFKLNTFSYKIVIDHSTTNIIKKNNIISNNETFINIFIFIFIFIFLY